MLNRPDGLILVNNKHPMVIPATWSAGYRLVLHGLASEMLHALLVEEKRRRVAALARMGRTGSARACFFPGRQFSDCLPQICGDLTAWARKDGQDQGRQGSWFLLARR